MITLDDIQASLHSIKVSDGTNDLLIDGSGHLSFNDGGNSITVDAAQLDIDDLDSASDSVEIKTAAGQALLIDASGHLSINDGGNSITVDGTVAATQSGSWSVDVADGGGSITVDAVDLDIRDLAFATDSVTAHQGGTWAVETTPGGYASWKVSAESVDATVGGTEIVSVPLTGRLSILVQNLGSQDIYLKEATGVTTVNGMKLPKGSSFAANLDDGANLFAITGSGSSDLRVVEYAS